MGVVVVVVVVGGGESGLLPPSLGLSLVGSWVKVSGMIVLFLKQVHLQNRREAVRVTIEVLVSFWVLEDKQQKNRDNRG